MSELNAGWKRPASGNDTHRLIAFLPGGRTQIVGAAMRWLHGKAAAHRL
jgi:hypothetical protein